MFHPSLLELVEKVSGPSVSAISSTRPKHTAQSKNRLSFIGDALAQKQLNTGQGTTFAAKEAKALADMIAGRMSPEYWEGKVLIEAENERLRSVVFASQWLSTWWGWAVSELKHGWSEGSQRLGKWWYNSVDLEN